MLPLGVPAVSRIRDVTRYHHGKAVDLLRDNLGPNCSGQSCESYSISSQANSIGCHIITATKDILSKLVFVGKIWAVLSKRRTNVYADAAQAGYHL